MSAIVLRLARIELSAYATYGMLLDEENRQHGVTLELPWKDNAPDVSCIPAGTYTAERYFSPHHGYDVFRLTDVPNRSDVEMHIGNLAKDSLGCILLGSNFGLVGDQHGITGSQAAFAKFMNTMGGVDSFTLTVTDPVK